MYLTAGAMEEVRSSDGLRFTTKGSWGGCHARVEVIPCCQDAWEIVVQFLDLLCPGYVNKASAPHLERPFGLRPTWLVVVLGCIVRS